MFKTLPIKDREMFLKYAIPCGDVLVDRGELKQRLLDKMKGSVIDQKELNYDIENTFKVATRMCTILGTNMGKSDIDEEVIRKYFLHEHEKAIQWRMQIKPDVIPEKCMVYPGRVVNTNSKGVTLNTPLGRVVAKDEFIDRLRTGDWVSMHYSQIAEKIPKKEADSMVNEFKERLEKKYIITGNNKIGDAVEI
ncbi:MAG: hypothetical protein JW716_04460 [Candidatus Aenigmarchaeota archaeon]|nr:hypothetical protein [Candidatus Aenigmarchaeota archaeon]